MCDEGTPNWASWCLGTGSHSETIYMPMQQLTVHEFVSLVQLGYLEHNTDRKNKHDKITNHDMGSYSNITEIFLFALPP